MSAKPVHSVSATQLVRDLAAIRAMTAQGPVGVTSHGRTELVVLNAMRFAELNANPDPVGTDRLEAKLSIVLDSIDTHVLIVDHDLCVRRINLAMRRSLRLSDQPMVGRHALDLLPPQIAPFLAKRLNEVHRSGKIAEFDFASVLSPGRTIHARMVPWPGGIAYFSDDITDRLASIEREMELSALREASLALGGRGNGVVSEGGELIKVDPGFCTLAGVSEEQLKGCKFATLFDHASRPRIEAAIDWRESRTSMLEVGVLRRSTEVVDARIALSPFFSRDGRPRYGFIINEHASR